MKSQEDKTHLTVVNKVKDPVRFPKVVNGYEGEAKVMYSVLQNSTFEELVKEMVKMQKGK